MLDQCKIPDNLNRLTLPLILGFSNGEVGMLETRNSVHQMKKYFNLDVPPLGEWRKLMATLAEQVGADHNLLHQHGDSTAQDTYVAGEHSMAKWKVSFEKLQRGQKEQGLLLNPSNQIKTDNRGQAELGNLREDMEKFKSKKQAHKVYLA